MSIQLFATCRYVTQQNDTIALASCLKYLPTIQKDSSSVGYEEK